MAHGDQRFGSGGGNDSPTGVFPTGRGGEDVTDPSLYGTPITANSYVARAAVERQRQQQALERQQQEQTNSLMSRIQKMVGGEGFDALKGYSPSPRDIGMGIGSAMLPMGLGLAMPALEGLNQFVGDATAPSLEGLSPDERQKVIDRVENSTTVGNSVTGPDYQFQGRLSLDDTFGYLDRPNEDKQGNFLNTVREFVNNPTFAGSQGIDQGNLDANLLQGFRAQGRDAIRGAFPGNAFQLDSDIIASIVGERRTNASTEVANFGDRGNIGLQGSLAANQDLTRQAEGATTRLGEIGAGVLGGFQQNINDIRDRATLANQGFQLGDDLFDVTPFADERSQLITDRTPTIRSGILSALGSEPLFDIPSTLGLAGRAQGNVSGVRNNNALLDQIANRQTTQSSRGLGTRGSGAF